MPKNRPSRMNRARRWAPYVAGQAFKYGARKLFNQSGSGSSTRNNTRQFISTGISTDHYDKKLKYRYKRMPKRKRKRYVSRTKFVKHVIDSQRPLTKCVNTTKFNPTATVGNQTWHATLFGIGIPVIDAAIATSATHNLMIDGYQQLNDVADATFGDTLFNDQWKQCSYAVNITITNHGLTTMLIDAYRVVCRKTLANSSYNTPYISNGQNETTYLLDMENGLTGASSNLINQLGVTPFSVTVFPKYFKILQVKEIQVPSQSTITLSYRIPKNYLFKMANLLGKVFIKGLTQGYIFRMKGVPDGADNWPAACSATVIEEKCSTVTKTSPSTWQEFYGSHA